MPVLVCAFVRYILRGESKPERLSIWKMCKKRGITKTIAPLLKTDLIAITATKEYKNDPHSTYPKLFLIS